MSFGPLRIKSDGTGVGTRIYFGDVEAPDVTHLSLDISVGNPLMATVTMRCYVGELDVEGFADVEKHPRHVAKMSDLEALERAFTAIGEMGARQLLDLAAELVAVAAKREASKPP